MSKLKRRTLGVAVIVAAATYIYGCGGAGLQIVCEEVDYPVPPVSEQDNTCLIYEPNEEILEPGDIIEVDIDIDIDIDVDNNNNVNPTPTPTPQPTATPVATPKEKCNNGGQSNKGKDKDFCPGTGPKK